VAIVQSKLACDDDDQVYYTSIIYEGYDLNASCKNWHDFSSVNLLLPSRNLQYSSIDAATVLYNATSNKLQNHTISCNNGSVVEKIVDALLMKQEVDYRCGDDNWRVFYNPSHVLSLCVNCSVAASSVYDQLLSPYLLNPCGSYQPSISFASFLSLEVSNQISYPLFSEPLEILSEKPTELVVRANLSQPGVCYCAAFPLDLTVSLIPMIKRQGHKANSLLGGEIDVIIDNVVPDENYKVYCYTEDFAGNGISLADVLATIQYARTACCKSIRFISKSSYISSASPSHTIFEFVLDSLPSAEMSVGIEVTSSRSSACPINNGKASSAVEISPSTVKFSPSSLSKSASFIIKQIGSGCYDLTVHPLVDSSSTYFNASTTIIVTSENTYAPTLTSATRGGDDARSIYLSFDSPTDKGLKTSWFSCNELFSFSTSNCSECLWLSNQLVLVKLCLLMTLDTSFPISVRSHVIQAANTSSLSLNIQNTSPNSTVIVPLPTARMYPEASLSSSQSISICNNLILDPTATSAPTSVGIKSIVWFVAGPGDVSSIQKLLDSYNSIDLLIAIPNNLLQVGEYTFSLTIINQLALSSVAKTKVLVQSDSTNIPAVRIAGSSIVSIYRSQSLRLIASELASTCGNSSSERLKYSWRIYEEGKLGTLPFPSKSLDPRRFWLSSYTLEVAKSYTVQVVVSSASASSSSASVVVHVGLAGLNAVIRGGSKQSVTRGSKLLLDASDSSQLDALPSTSILRYAWSCTSNDDNSYGESCQNLLSSNTSSLINFNAAGLSLPCSICKVSLVIQDNYGQSATTFTLISVHAVALPSVTVSNPSIKYNAEDKIIVSASLSCQSACSGRWASSDISELESKALTPISYSNIPTNHTAFYQLALRSSSLVAGLTYTLQFRANYLSAVAQTVNEISLVMNQAPLGGTLTISPSAGDASLTAFFFSTKSWYDSISDYPLTYSMKYISSSGNAMWFKTRDSVPFVSSYLGPGPRQQGYVVACYVLAYDVYNASASASATVIVQPTNITTTFIQTITSSLQTAALQGNTESIKQHVQSISSTFGAVDCSLAPNSFCASIHRNPCATTADTCGSCLNSFVGIIGDSNIPCKAEDAVKSIGESCSSNDLCITNYCSGGLCSYTNQSCPSCSSNGACQYRDRLTLSSVSQCLQNDSSCESICVCSSGYFGNDCSQTAVEYQQSLDVYGIVCEQIYALYQLEDIDEEVIQSRANSVNDLIRKTSQVDSSVFAQCFDALAASISSNYLVASSSSTYSAVSSSLNAILSRPGNFSDSTKTNLYQALSMYSQGLQSYHAVDEPVREITESNLRISVSLETVDQIAKKHSPLNDFERINKISSSSIQVTLTGLSQSSSTALGTTIVSTGRLEAGRNSYPVGISNAIYTYDSAVGMSSERVSGEFEILIINKYPIVYETAEARSFEYTCQLAEAAYNVTANCTGLSNSDYKKIFQCPGDAVLLYNYTCPKIEEIPSCEINSYADAQDYDCYLKEYSSFNSTCVCSTTLITGRRLSDMQQVTMTSLTEFSSSSDILFRSFISRWKQSISSDTIQQNLVISIIVTAVLALLFVGLIQYVFIDLQEIKLHRLPSGKIPLKGFAAFRKKKIQIYQKKLIKFFNSLLPIEFSGQAWYVRLYHKLLVEHDWLCLVFPFDSSRDYRSVRWLLAMGRALHVLFITTILAGLYFADDGTCEAYHVKSKCLDDRSLNRIDNLCVWDESSDQCSFNKHIASTFFGRLLLTAVITTVSIPFDKFFLFMIHRVRDLSIVHLTSMSKANQGKEKELKEIRTELTLFQSFRSTILRAARLARMQSSMDNTSVDSEVSFILSPGKLQRSFSFRSISDNESAKEDVSVSSYIDDSITKNPASESILSVIELLRSANVDDNFHPQEIKACLQEKEHRHHNSHRSSISSQTSISFQRPRVAPLSSDVLDEPVSGSGSFTSEGSSKKQRIVTKKLLRAREESDKIVQDLGRISNAYSQEVFLLQHFLVNCLTGLKKRIVYRYFFREHDTLKRLSKRSYIEYICMVVLPLYLMSICFYIFMFGISIGSRATNIWLLSCLISITMDIFILQPIKIWIKWIALSALASDIRVWHGMLRDRSKMIMMRTSGLMSESNSLIQHFNPACRAARAYPHLSASRLLMSLNDDDLPAQCQLANLSRMQRFFSWFFVIGGATLLMLTLFPLLVQEVAIEFIGIAVFHMFIVGIAASSDVSFIVPLVLILTVIMLLIIREYYAAKKRKEARLVLEVISPNESHRAMIIGDEIRYPVDKSELVKESSKSRSLVSMMLARSKALKNRIRENLNANNAKLTVHNLITKQSNAGLAKPVTSETRTVLSSEDSYAEDRMYNMVQHDKNLRRTMPSQNELDNLIDAVKRATKSASHTSVMHPSSSGNRSARVFSARDMPSASAKTTKDIDLLDLDDDDPNASLDSSNDPSIASTPHQIYGSSYNHSMSFSPTVSGRSSMRSIHARVPSLKTMPSAKASSYKPQGSRLLDKRFSISEDMIQEMGAVFVEEAGGDDDDEDDDDYDDDGDRSPRALSIKSRTRRGSIFVTSARTDYEDDSYQLDIASIPSGAASLNSTGKLEFASSSQSRSRRSSISSRSGRVAFDQSISPKATSIHIPQCIPSPQEGSPSLISPANRSVGIDIKDISGRKTF
jgi:hypothetical protein